MFGKKNRATIRDRVDVVFAVFQLAPTPSEQIYEENYQEYPVVCRNTNIQFNILVNSTNARCLAVPMNL